MPFDSLTLLAVLAFGLMWLLGIFLTSNVELFRVIVMHTFVIGFFFYFIHYTTMSEEKLTWILLPPTCHLTGCLDRHFVPNKVHALDPDFHCCTWKCHHDFDCNNCILLCGDNCIHLNCNNHCHPDLFPPPASYPSTSVSASLPFQCQSASTFIDTYANDILLRYCHPQAHPTTPDQVDGAYLKFIILCLNLNDYIIKYARDHRNCCSALNQHKHRQVHWSSLVPPRPLSRHGIPTRSPCSAFLAAMGRGSMGLRGREEGHQSGKSTAVSSSDEGQPLWVLPPKPPWYHSWISMSCPPCLHPF